MAERTPPQRTTYQGLNIGRELTDMPTELGELAMSYLPDREVGRMQSTGRKGVERSRKQMEELCNSLPNEREIASYLYDGIKTLRSTQVGLYSATGRVAYKGIEAESPVVSIVQTNTISLYSADVKIFTIASRTDTDDDGNPEGTWTHLEMPLDQEVDTSPSLDIPQGIPDPFTVLRILRRRKSCRTRYLETNKVDRYGLDLTYVYLTEVLRPRLAQVVGDRVDEVYTTPRDSVRALMLPLPEDLPSLERYQRNVQELVLLVRGWLNADTDILTNHVNNEPHAPFDADSVYDAATDVLRALAGLRARVYKGLDHEAAEERTDRLPTDREVVDWVDRKIKRGDSFGVGVLDLEPELPEAYSFVFINGQPRNTQRYVLDENKRLRVTTDPTQWRDARNTRKLTWLFDPTTVLDVTRDRIPGIEGTLNRYGIAVVRDYLRVVTRDYLEFLTVDPYSIYTSEDNAELIRDNLKKRHGEEVGTLELIAYGWLGAGTEIQRKSATRGSGERDVQEMTRSLIGVLEALKEYHSQLSDVAGGDEADESSEEGESRDEGEDENVDEGIEEEEQEEEEEVVEESEEDEE